MNRKSSALHATKPRHLPLSKLMDGNLQPLEHLAECRLADDVLRHIFIFQTVVDKVFSRNATIEQCTNLINHAFVEALAKTTANLFTPCLTADAYTIIIEGTAGMARSSVGCSKL